MEPRFERRRACRRVIGIERRGAPLSRLEGNPLPDPTLLLDEDFLAAMREAAALRERQRQEEVPIIPPPWR